MTFIGFDYDGPIRTSPGPKIRVINYSGGRQSTALCEMVLQGDLEPPDLVLTADPGMEHTATYAHVAAMQARLNTAGIEALTVPGPNLYQDIVQLKTSGNTRLDNPPYFTERNGKAGRLRQKCTLAYKIRPMDRALRAYMLRAHGIALTSSRMGANLVEKWIGFSSEETSRVSTSPQKYIYFRYPLMELGLTKQDCIDYLISKGQPVPPPSVCVGCFSNTAADYREMQTNAPQDFQKAVAVDEAVRDLQTIGVTQPTYVHRSLTPLRVLVNQEPDEEDEGSCDSGYCFT